MTDNVKKLNRLEEHCANLNRKVQELKSVLRHANFNTEELKEENSLLKEKIYSQNRKIARLETRLANASEQPKSMVEAIQDGIGDVIGKYYARTGIKNSRRCQ